MFENEAEISEVFHIYNRGVDKRETFIDDKDRQRFLDGLVRFNLGDDERNKAVKIISFSLLPNHYHLLLEEVFEGGISKFMQRLGTGYTMYFNKRYKRTGSLFETSYKSLQIQKEAHFLHISRYIHLNPLSIIQPKWKSLGVKNIDRAKRFLNNYKWSSYTSYIGKKEIIPIDKKRVLDSFKDENDYEQFIVSWINDFYRLN